MSQSGGAILPPAAASVPGIVQGGISVGAGGNSGTLAPTNPTEWAAAMAAAARGGRVDDAAQSGEVCWVVVGWEFFY